MEINANSASFKSVNSRGASPNKQASGIANQGHFTGHAFTFGLYGAAKLLRH
jgi:PBP1b-binding outer membrane lipoprotein LpoB